MNLVLIKKCFFIKADDLWRKREMTPKELASTLKPVLGFYENGNA
jgi:hypothetical protein